MAIKTELVDNGGRIRHYSDNGFRILQVETGIVYDEAVDVLPCRYTYTETNEAIPEEVAYYKGYRMIPEVITAALAFSNGEIGYWPQDGKFYESQRNGNTWPPSIDPDNWEVVEV